VTRLRQSLDFRLGLRYPEDSKMANHFSALKRVRQDAKRTEFNRAAKSQLRHQIRTMRRLLTAKDGAGATAALAATFSVIDRSAKNGMIKKNTAARYKSRLHKKVKALQPA
jgi:small subunit ribosomal protein S20